MTIETRLVGGVGSDSSVSISKNGQMLTNTFDYSTAYNVKADVDGTAYNLVSPRQGMNFVITDILLYANKSVGAADATVVLYENSIGPDSTTETKVIFTTEMLKNTRADLTGLNLLVNEGRWINIKTDDDDIFATIFGYYIPVV